MDDRVMAIAIVKETEDGVALLMPRDVAAAAGLSSGRRVSLDGSAVEGTLRLSLLTDQDPPRSGKRFSDAEARAKIDEIQARIAARGNTGLVADKAFFDELSGDE